MSVSSNKLLEWKPQKLKWWIKFLLFFRPSIYSADIGMENYVIIRGKTLFGIVYILDEYHKKVSHERD